MDRLITQLADALSFASERLKFQKGFTRRASGTGPDTVAFRRELARRFRVIHRRIKCAHQEAELLILAEAILSLKVDGPIVELGCFKGGSTAKLSLVARATGRSLVVFDSFEGLPLPEGNDGRHELVSGKVKSYGKGEYCGGLEEVRANVERWGDLGVCSFVKGYYSETLPASDVSPAFVFMDVDLIESGRTCMKALWSKLRPGGLYYTHEAGSATFLDGLLDPDWWHGSLGTCPPMLFGAGFGHGSVARHLACFRKTEKKDGRHG